MKVYRGEDEYIILEDDELENVALTAPRRSTSRPLRRAAFNVAGITPQQVDTHLINGKTKESVIVDRLLRSTEALYVRKQALFVEMEQSLFEGMLELWPSIENPEALRIAAMTGMGVLRLAMDKWRQENAKLPLATMRAKCSICSNAKSNRCPNVRLVTQRVGEGQRHPFLAALRTSGNIRG